MKINFYKNSVLLHDDINMEKELYQMPVYVLTVPQIRECEQYTMEHEPISSLDLMERAGKACAEHIEKIAVTIKPSIFYIFCGTGNNGGDGLVVARHLLHQSNGLCQSITVIVCQNETPHCSTEMKNNLERWQQIVSTVPQAHLEYFDANKSVEIPSDAIIVDAIFGIGLSKPVSGIFAQAIQAINHSDAFTIAIDTPSGLFSDKPTPIDGNIVMAQCTLSIQYQKTAFLLPDNFPFCGNVDILDIGMFPPPELIFDKECLTLESLSPMVHKNNPFAHKGTFGHGLLIAGSADMPGAAILAATAALRGGIGKITVHTAGLAAQALPIALPEAILHRDPDYQHVSLIQWESLQHSINAIAIGPGLGTHPQTFNTIKDVLDNVTSPIILDADALNMLAENKTWLAFLPKNSILTPHFKEFEKLAGPSQNGFERLEKAKTFAQKYEIILILKGHHTSISLPDGKQFFNTTGNEGMATAGSGDTLTGLLLALLARGYNPVETAFLGVFIHGLAGDTYASENHPSSLIASDLPKYFGKALSKITQTK